ncbi:MAG TPA: extracellular solute-binding protein [Verrucomicrobiae bacterium]|nr:extracellular solute-binding protein [Verrucomicrobiae bacterium]
MRLILSLAIVLLTASCKNNQWIVTVYASQDQVYAEPILRQFEQETGIRVRAIYDSEAVKTVGLVNRLIAEKANPQCDVFWNNEELRTRQLESRGVVERWAAVGFRSRGMIVNTNLLSSPPKSLVDLTNAVWKRKAALAYPLFGTTATHFLALRQQWGAETWEHWCRALKANEPFLVDGNSVVVQLVGRGEAVIGLTDSDDIAAGQKQGLPIRAVPLAESTLLIPNTVAIIRGAPNPTEAQRLYEHLQSESVRKALIAASALEGDRPGHIGFKPDWVRLLADLEPATATLKTVFLR